MLIQPTSHSLKIFQKSIKLSESIAKLNIHNKIEDEDIILAIFIVEKLDHLMLNECSIYFESDKMRPNGLAEICGLRVIQIETIQ